MKKLKIALCLLATGTQIFSQGSFRASPGGLVVPSPSRLYPGTVISSQPGVAYPQECIQPSCEDIDSRVFEIFKNAQEVKMVSELPNGDKVFIVNGLPEYTERVIHGIDGDIIKTTAGYISGSAIVIYSVLFQKWIVRMGPDKRTCSSSKPKKEYPLLFSGKSKDGSEILLQSNKIEVVFSIKDGVFIFNNPQKL